MRKLFFLFALSTLVSPGYAQKATIEGDQVAYQKLTLSWEGPQGNEAAQTFLNFRMEVEFTDPTGKSTVVPGYFAGDGMAGESSATEGNIWRAHLLPLIPGDWQYQARFYQADRAAIASTIHEEWETSFHGDAGEFQVAPPDGKAPGFLSKGKLAYTGGHFLQFTNGDYFLKMGANSPEVFLEYSGFDGTDSDRDYPAHLKDWEETDPVWQGGKGKGILGVVNYLQDQGINAHYFLLMNAYGDGKKAYPWKGPDAYYEYDLSKLDQWQQVFDHMMASGLMPQFVLSEQENQSYFEAKEGGVFADSRKVYYREMAARFGYLNAVTWNIGEESGWGKESTEEGKANSTEQRKDFAAYLEDLLPANELIVVHNGPSNTDAIFDGLLGDSPYTGISYQGNFEDSFYGYERIRHWREQSALHGQPWVVTYDEPYTNPEFPDLDTWRKNALWAALIAGGAGVEIYFGSGKDLTIQDYRLYEKYWKTMDRAKSFFLNNNLPFEKLKPMNPSETTGWGLALDSEELVIYLPEGGKGQVILPSGTYRIHWYDPRMGEMYTTGEPIEVAEKEKVSLGQAPHDAENDWVVWISRD
ncbi:DUF5060 domain-containing protein [Cyclobacterium roseum]|uniref:DUF5060 domain-containing protein n=1 Tax=Cyclobacterium roseum TaxID=2666137 RepID=UPI001391F1DD|nr:DUF5060 domain-containing protein [Cyclobacterium roseum]